MKQDLNIHASLHFVRGQLLLEYPEKQGMVRKCISPDAVRSALLLQQFDSGWITPHTIRHGENHHGPWVIQRYPAAAHTLRFNDPLPMPGTKTLLMITVPLPELLFIGAHNSYSLFAIRVWQHEATVLYHTPLPNVGETGQVCFGSVAIPKASPHSMNEAWQLFWNSSFNSDLTTNKSRAHHDNIIDQLCHVAQQRLPQYPGADLIRTRFTIAQILAQLNHED